jgi:hypothetical protein
VLPGSKGAVRYVAKVEAGGLVLYSTDHSN